MNAVLSQGCEKPTAHARFRSSVPSDLSDRGLVYTSRLSCCNRNLIPSNSPSTLWSSRRVVSILPLRVFVYSSSETFLIGVTENIASVTLCTKGAFGGSLASSSCC